jgi:predicted thioredoxin/glutaredoxin
MDQGHQVTIYLAQHCQTSTYAYQVAEEIRQAFPHVQVRLVDLEQTTEPIPEAVFATPTYLLDGRLWSLGNPAPEQVKETLSRLSLPLDQTGEH